MQISDTLENFVTKWRTYHNDSLPSMPFDPQWPSPCFDANDPQPGEIIHWQPKKQTSSSDMFTRLGEALDTTIHPDITEYFNCYWSDHLNAQAPAGNLVLLQVWNEEDLERLRANFIGHAMVQSKQKQPLSLFFACTEPDDGMLTVRNDDGSIWLQYPGKKPIKQIADNLCDFINQLSPR